MRSIFVACALLFCGFAPAGDAGVAPSGATPADTDGEEALYRALMRRIEVRPGVPVQHCRRAPSGCEARVRAFVRSFYAAGSETGLDPWVLAAVALQESGLSPLALGGVGERGIVQVNPRRRDIPARMQRFFDSREYRAACLRRDDACQDAFVRYGARLLSRSVERCGDLVGGLQLYNTGRCEGRRYARRVLRNVDDLRRIARVETQGNG